MKVKNFKRKTHLGKMTLSFAVCFMMLCGFTFLTHVYASSPITGILLDAPISITLTPNYDEGVFSITLTPTGSPMYKIHAPLNIFAIPGHKTKNQIPVIDYEVDDLPAPSFKLVNTGITAKQFFDNNEAVTFSFDSSVFTEGQEYTIFAYFQREDEYCDHFASELYYYTHLVPVPLPPDPVKEGHTFVGWYYDPEYTQPYDGAPIYEDTVLYAKFIPNIYTITFDTLGGNTLEPIEAEYNTTITPPTPTRLGHKFLGWYIDINLTEPFDAENTLITSDITLYAKWEVQTVTVTFMVDGEVYTTLEVPYGSILINDTTAAQYVAAMGKLYLDAEKKSCLILTR